MWPCRGWRKRYVPRNVGVGRVRKANRLHAVVAGETVRELEVEGTATTFEFERDGRRLVASGRQLLQTGPTSWQLLGSDTELARIDVPPGRDGSSGTVRAPRIELHRVGAQALLVDARCSPQQRAAVDATIVADAGRAPQQVHATVGRPKLQIVEPLVQELARERGAVRGGEGLNRAGCRHIGRASLERAQKRDERTEVAIRDGVWRHASHRQAVEHQTRELSVIARPEALDN